MPQTRSVAGSSVHEESKVDAQELSTADPSEGGEAQSPTMAQSRDKLSRIFSELAMYVQLSR